MQLANSGMYESLFNVGQNLVLIQTGPVQQLVLGWTFFFGQCFPNGQNFPQVFRATVPFDLAGLQQNFVFPLKLAR